MTSATIDLGSLQMVSGVTTQGSDANSHWVTEYTVKIELNFLCFIFQTRHFVQFRSKPIRLQVEYSVDNINYVQVRDSFGVIKKYTGNNDQNTKKSNSLPAGTAARFVRVLPVTWSGQAAMRISLDSCDIPSLYSFFNAS